jgi:hypothetical protein
MLLMALAVVGCAHRNDIALRPPKRPEELVLPPVADGRFSSPPRYPESINQDLDSERRGTGQAGMPNMGAMNMGGMGGGMGGMGGMGGGMPMMGGMGMGSMLGGYGR